jgi:hypothetical protein
MIVTLELANVLQWCADGEAMGSTLQFVSQLPENCNPIMCAPAQD